MDNATDEDMEKMLESLREDPTRVRIHVESDQSDPMGPPDEDIAKKIAQGMYVADFGDMKPILLGGPGEEGMMRHFQVTREQARKLIKAGAAWSGPDALKP